MQARVARICFPMLTNCRLTKEDSWRIRQNPGGSWATAANQGDMQPPADHGRPAAVTRDDSGMLMCCAAVAHFDVRDDSIQI